MRTCVTVRPTTLVYEIMIYEFRLPLLQSTIRKVCVRGPRWIRSRCATHSPAEPDAHHRAPIRRTKSPSPASLVRQTHLGTRGGGSRFPGRSETPHTHRSHSPAESETQQRGVSNADTDRPSRPAECSAETGLPSQTRVKRVPLVPLPVSRGTRGYLCVNLIIPRAVDSGSWMLERTPSATKQQTRP